MEFISTIATSCGSSPLLTLHPSPQGSLITEATNTLKHTSRFRCWLTAYPYVSHMQGTSVTAMRGRPFCPCKSILARPQRIMHIVRAAQHDSKASATGQDHKHWMVAAAAAVLMLASPLDAFAISGGKGGEYNESITFLPWAPVNYQSLTTSGYFPTPKPMHCF